jgi:DNA-binding LacI/PurR family transcriptional regulator
MATIQDVAKKAGVSISTVSYVLSGIRPISEATKARIYLAMDEIGYRPNAIAQGLASRKSRIIALIISPTERGLGSTEMEFVNGAAQAARQLGYHLVLWADAVDTPADLEELGRRGLVEGVLLMEVSLRDWRVAVLARLGIPLAVIGQPTDTTGLAWVDIDFDHTMTEALDWLVSAGHRNMVLINQSRESYDAGYGPVVRIQEAFFRQCTERRLTAQAAFCHAEAESGYEAIRSLLREHPQTTAVLAMNDPALPGIFHGLSEAGRRVPEDVSVLALLSSAQVARHFWPALSTLDVPGKELGHLGISRLIQRLEAGGGPESASPSLLPCTLSLRGTTGKHAAVASEIKETP